MATKEFYERHTEKKALSSVAAWSDLEPTSTKAVKPGHLAPLGYTQIADLSDAVGLGTLPTGATVAVIKAEAQAVRWRDDGINPTATVGIPMAVADAPYTYVGTLSAIKFIEATAGAILNISFYS